MRNAIRALTLGRVFTLVISALVMVCVGIFVAYLIVQVRPILIARHDVVELAIPLSIALGAFELGFRRLPRFLSTARISWYHALPFGVSDYLSFYVRTTAVWVSVALLALAVASIILASDPSISWVPVFAAPLLAALISGMMGLAVGVYTGISRLAADDSVRRSGTIRSHVIGYGSTIVSAILLAYMALSSTTDSIVVRLILLSIAATVFTGVAYGLLVVARRDILQHEASVDRSVARAESRRSTRTLPRWVQTILVPIDRHRIRYSATLSAQLRASRGQPVAHIVSRHLVATTVFVLAGIYLTVQQSSPVPVIIVVVISSSILFMSSSHQLDGIMALHRPCPVGFYTLFKSIFRLPYIISIYPVVFASLISIIFIRDNYTFIVIVPIVLSLLANSIWALLYSIFPRYKLLSIIILSITALSIVPFASDPFMILPGILIVIIVLARISVKRWYSHDMV